MDESWLKNFDMSMTQGHESYNTLKKAFRGYVVTSVWVFFGWEGTKLLLLKLLRLKFFALLSSAWKTKD